MNTFVGKKIGEGACSEVFEWGDGSRIVKVAKPNTDRHAIQSEFHNTLIAWENGLPAPRPYEVVEIEGRPGIVFERIYGVGTISGQLLASCTRYIARPG